MARRLIQSHVFPAYRTMVSLPQVKRAAAEALSVADSQGTIGASVVIADDDTLRGLNHRFRGIDQVTDVLSFSSGQSFGGSGHGPEDESDFPLPPEEATDWSLGEVVVSYPQAARQAAEHGWAADRELALLVVHGILHLLGHDHAEVEEAAVMKVLEDQALARLFPAEPAGVPR